MPTATEVDFQRQATHGHWKLYKLDPPLTYTDWSYDDETDESVETRRHAAHVIVSTASVPFSGPETYIFHANAVGEIANWMELPGSFRGGLDHAQALANAGYDIA